MEYRAELYTTLPQLDWPEDAAPDLEDPLAELAWTPSTVLLAAALVVLCLALTLLL